VVADSPDEKRQPAIVIKGKATSDTSCLRVAHLMVQDGDTVFPGDVLAKIPRRQRRPRHPGGLPRVVELFEAASRERPRSSAKSMAWFASARWPKDSATQWQPITARRGIFRSARRPHQRAGRRARPAGEPLMDGPLNPHDILAVLGEKDCSLPGE